MTPRLFIAVLLLSIPTLGAAEDKEKTLRHSSFRAANISRDPFERIDAKYLVERMAVVVPVGIPADGGLDNLFRVTALSIDRLSIAVINGKAFAEKEVFKMKTKEKEMRVTLLKVTQAGVELDCNGTILKVPLVHEKPSFVDGP
jgi:hypothetical protein